MDAALGDYELRRGSTLDRAALVKFMDRTYQELFPGGNFSHLAQTVENYLSRETPIWWVLSENTLIAGLWMGNAIDQISGDRHSHVFLLYVDPNHRRRGIAGRLMQTAETWAGQRGDRQIGLQVFSVNPGAIGLYKSLGYEVQSVTMVKPLG
jgi:ribosomal protein S18 acetylase RimI-like enzyme